MTVCTSQGFPRPQLYEVTARCYPPSNGLFLSLTFLSLEDQKYLWSCVSDYFETEQIFVTPLLSRSEKTCLTISCDKNKAKTMLAVLIKYLPGFMELLTTNLQTNDNSKTNRTKNFYT